ncbi:hypothetical protein D3C79_705180 [compost metagenome]
MLLDQRGQATGAFDVEDDLGARVARQHVLGKQHQQAVGVDDAAGVGHHADAVAVTVEGQADIGAGFLDLGDQVFEVFRLARVRVVVGEVAVDLAEQRDHFAAQGFDQLRRDHAGGTVAAVHDHLELLGQLHVFDDLLEVAVKDLDLFHAAFGAGQVVGFQSGQQGLDLFVGQGIASDDDLEAVVVRRVVAAGQHHTGLAGQHVGCVVQRRGGHQADVADLAAGIDQALDQLFDQHRAGQAAIAADRNLRFALGQALRADGAADPVGGFGVKGLADHAAYVICAENAVGQCGGDQVGHVVHLWKLH